MRYAGGAGRSGGAGTPSPLISASSNTLNPPASFFHFPAIYCSIWVSSGMLLPKVWEARCVLKLSTQQKPWKLRMGDAVSKAIRDILGDKRPELCIHLGSARPRLTAPGSVQASRTVGKSKAAPSPADPTAEGSPRRPRAFFW